MQNPSATACEDRSKTGTVCNYVLLTLIHHHAKAYLNCNPKRIIVTDRQMAGRQADLLFVTASVTLAFNPKMYFVFLLFWCAD